MTSHDDRCTVLRHLQLQVRAASWRVQRHSDTQQPLCQCGCSGIAIPNSFSVNQHHPFYVILSMSSSRRKGGRLNSGGGRRAFSAHHTARTTHCVGERARGVHIPQEKEKERVREGARSGLGERVERARERVYESE